MNDEQKTDLYLRLSEAARDRFKNRQAYEWKVCFAVWTALGASSGFLLGSGNWHPTPVAITITSIGCVLLLGIFSWWTYRVNKSGTQDAQTAYFWESGVEEVLATKLHPDLQPESGGRKWLRMEHPAGTNPPKAQLFHYASVTQIGITVILLLLFWYASVRTPADSGRKASEITIKGREHDKVIIEPGDPTKP